MSHTAPHRDGPELVDSHVATLLVVDDEALNRDVLSRRFEKHGFRVHLAANGRDALDVLAHHACDLVLLDVMMPVMSGLEVLASIRRTPALRELPVVMVTAKSDSRDVVEALDLGADDYVTKPLDFPVALARVRAQLTRVATEQAALAVQRHGDLQHAQKLSAVGQLAGGVAHDFNNLLTAISGYGEFLQDGLPADDARQDDVRHILKAAGSAAALTRQLLAFSHRHPATPQATDIGAVATSMAHLLRRVISEHVDLVVTRPEHVWPVFGDAGQLDQVIMNLVVNACDAMPRGGRLSIDLDHVDLGVTAGSGAGAQFVRLTVRDSGCGMDAATMARIFEPFFTTKSVGRGTGLGLAMVRHIVEQMGGSVTVVSEIGAGTTFSVLLPRCEHGVVAAAPTPAAAPGGRASGTALLVEDDHEVRLFLRHVLERDGYSVVDASRGDLALEAASRLPSLDLLVTDLVMPGMGGVALWTALHGVRPEVSVVFMSGHGTLVVDHPRDAGLPVLQKPFGTQEFLSAVRRVRRVCPTESSS